MDKLHPNQQRLLDILKENITDPLTIRELQEILGLASPSVVHHHIVQLEKKGFLRRNPSNSQDYNILADSPDKKISYVSLYGLAQCGPNGSILDGNPIDSVPISTKLLGFSSKDAFMVKAKGDSMAPKIKENDIVIVQRTAEPQVGSMVVCVNDGMAMIKTLKKNASDSQFVLSSLNEKYDPIITSDDFRVEGVVKGVLQYT